MSQRSKEGEFCINTLGIYISTIKSEQWEGLFSNLVTDVDFEIVLVGPTKKKSSLPDNVKFIKSNECPAKCFHIGAMACNSKYIMNLNDDCRFVENFALDKLIAEIKTKPFMSMVSARYPQYVNQTFVQQKKPPPWNPLMPIGPLMEKKLYIDLGGIDRRFVNLYWCMDLAMMVYERGGEIFVIDAVEAYEADLKDKDRPKGLSGTRRSQKDLALVFALWCKGRRKRWVPQKKRKDKVRSYIA